LAGAGPAAVGAAGPDGTTSRVSIGSDETQGDGGLGAPAMSPNGRFVVFTEFGASFGDGDTNNTWDVFVRDRTLATTSRVSVSSSERLGNDRSAYGVVSADGRYVAFISWASNLVRGDTNRSADVFVRDRTLGTTRRVSVSSGERQGNNDSTTGFPASISADGRFVAFASEASNLVRGDTNRALDVFVRDLRQGITRRMSVNSNERQGNAASVEPVLSADGKRVLFLSSGSNLVSGDTNRSADVFMRYRPNGTTHRISVSNSDAQGNGDSGGGVAVSPDGLYVAFSSGASNMVSSDTNAVTDVFVRDRIGGTTQRVSVNSDGVQGDDPSRGASISADGQSVAFDSFATNLVDGDTNSQSDVFVRDRVAGTTYRASVSSDGTQGDFDSGGPSISGDGSQVAFESFARNLVPGDTNGGDDAFVREFGP